MRNAVSSTCPSPVREDIQTYFSYPGQESGDAKIPTVLYYTPEGKVFAMGAEATSPAIRLETEDNELIFVEW